MVQLHRTGLLLVTLLLLFVWRSAQASHGFNSNELVWKLSSPLGETLSTPTSMVLAANMDAQLWGTNFTISSTFKVLEHGPGNALKTIFSRQSESNRCGGLYLGVRGAAIEFGSECVGGVRFSKHKVILGKPLWVAVSVRGREASLFMDGSFKEKVDVMNYRVPCPEGWVLGEDGLCNAPSTYSKQCCKTNALPACKADFRGMTVAQREKWARSCNVLWPALEFANRANDVTIGASNHQQNQGKSEGNLLICGVSVFRKALEPAQVTKYYRGVRIWAQNCGGDEPRNHRTMTQGKSTRVEGDIDMSESQSGEKAMMPEAKVKFNGPTKENKGSRVTLHDVPANMWHGKFTVSAVVSFKDAESDDAQVLLNRSNENNPCGGPELSLQKGNFILSEKCKSAKSITFDADLGDLKTAQVMVAYDGESGDAKLYVNGEVKSSAVGERDYTKVCPDGWLESSDGYCMDSKLQPLETGCNLEGSKGCAEGSFCCHDTHNVFGDAGNHCSASGTCLQKCESDADPRNNMGYCVGTPAEDKSQCCEDSKLPKCKHDFRNSEEGTKKDFEEKCKVKWPIRALEFTNHGSMEVGAADPSGTSKKWKGVICSLDIYPAALSAEEVDATYTTKQAKVEECAKLAKKRDEGSDDASDKASDKSDSDTKAGNTTQGKDQGKSDGDTHGNNQHGDAREDGHDKESQANEQHNKDRIQKEDICDQMKEDTAAAVTRIAKEMGVTKQALECAWHWSKPFPGYSALKDWMDSYRTTTFKETFPGEAYQPLCLTTATMKDSVKVLKEISESSGHTLDECFNAMKSREASLKFIVNMKLDPTLSEAKVEKCSNFFEVPPSSLPWNELHEKTEHQQEEILKGISPLILQAERISQMTKHIVTEGNAMSKKGLVVKKMSAGDENELEEAYHQEEGMNTEHQETQTHVAKLADEFSQWLVLFGEVKEWIYKKGLAAFVLEMKHDQHNFMVKNRKDFGDAQGRVLEKIDQLRDTNRYLWDKMMNATNFAEDGLNSFITSMTELQHHWEAETNTVKELYDNAHDELLAAAGEALQRGMDTTLKLTGERLNLAMTKTKRNIKKYITGRENADSLTVTKVEERVNSVAEFFTRIDKEIKRMKKEEEDVENSGRSDVSRFEAEVNGNIADIEKFESTVGMKHEEVSKALSTLSTEYMDLVSSSKESVLHEVSLSQDNMMKSHIIDYIHKIEKHYDWVLNNMEVNVEGLASQVTKITNGVQNGVGAVGKLDMDINQGKIPIMHGSLEQLKGLMDRLSRMLGILQKNNHLGMKELVDIATESAQGTRVSVTAPDVPDIGNAIAKYCQKKGKKKNCKQKEE